MTLHIFADAEEVEIAMLARWDCLNHARKLLRFVK